MVNVEKQIVAGTGSMSITGSTGPAMMTKPKSNHIPACFEVKKWCAWAERTTKGCTKAQAEAEA